MTDWPAIIAMDFAVPAGCPPRDFLAELFDGLCSPDPVLRDDQAYPVLATWIISGKLDDHLAAIGERAIAQFGHPELQARTFAALICTSWPTVASGSDLTPTRSPCRTRRRSWLGLASCCTPRSRRKPDRDVLTRPPDPAS